MSAWKAKYQKYMRSEAWRSKRRQVLNRAKGRCEKCRERNADHVHHITYQQLGNEPLHDLIALCWQCHNDEHPHRNLDPAKAKLRQLRKKRAPLSKLDRAWIDFKDELKRREQREAQAERYKNSERGPKRKRRVSKRERQRRADESLEARLRREWDEMVRVAEQRW